MTVRTSSPWASLNYAGPGYDGYGLGGSLSSLAQAIFEAPNIAAEAQARQAQGEYYKALSAKAAVDAQRAQAELGGANTIAGLWNDLPANLGRKNATPVYTAGAPTPGASMAAEENAASEQAAGQQFLSALPSRIASAAAYLPAAEQGQIADIFRFVAANSGLPDEAVGRAVVGSGQLIGENDAVSLPDREGVAARNQGNVMEKTIFEQDAATARNDADIAGAYAREQLSQSGQNARSASTIAKGDLQTIDGFDENGVPIIGSISRADYYALPPDKRPRLNASGLSSVINQANKEDKPTKSLVDPGDSELIDAEIKKQTDGVDAPLSGDNMTLVRVETQRLMDQGQPLAAAVQGALKKLGAKPVGVGDWLTDNEMTLNPPATDGAGIADVVAPAAPAAGPAPTPSNSNVGERRVQPDGTIWERGPDSLVRRVN